MTILAHMQSMHMYILKHTYLGPRYIKVNSMGSIGLRIFQVLKYAHKLQKWTIADKISQFDYLFPTIVTNWGP